METDSYQNWHSQLRKGYLELCVLTTLGQKKSSYGFELLQVFQQAGIEVNEGTLYPLLNRMHKNGWLVSKWETPSFSGHPRRYYELSRVGKSVLPKMLNANTLNQQSLEQLGKLI